MSNRPTNKRRNTFKHLLSSKTKFEWTSQLDKAIELSKANVVESIRKGVEIYDPCRHTCLQPDWSKTGIGFSFLKSIVTVSNLRRRAVLMDGESLLYETYNHGSPTVTTT